MYSTVISDNGNNHAAVARHSALAAQAKPASNGSTTTADSFEYESPHIAQCRRGTPHRPPACQPAQPAQRRGRCEREHQQLVLRGDPHNGLLVAGVTGKAGSP